MVYNSVLIFDISKAFEKVWLESLFNIHVHKRAGIRRKLLFWFLNDLSDRFQRVNSLGRVSTLNRARAGIPQGSVLEPLLFLVSISDIVDGIQANIDLFADDAS